MDEAQISSGIIITYEDDVDHQSFWLDIKIIDDGEKVFFREEISALGEATMPKFNPQITQIRADFLKDETA
ncbi:MAG: hypothetical protein V2B19_02140 [Pseudomonadota bacterium]